MVLHKYGDRLYSGLIGALTSHLCDLARKIEEKEGLAFLSELKRHWDDHNKSTQMIRDILMVRAACVACACARWAAWLAVKRAHQLGRGGDAANRSCRRLVRASCLPAQGRHRLALQLPPTAWLSRCLPPHTHPPTHACAQYMDRTYVAQQQRTPVFTLGLELWRNHVVRSKHIAERMRSVLLELVHKERMGETIDRALFRSITQVGGWLAWWARGGVGSPGCMPRRLRGMCSWAAAGRAAPAASTGRLPACPSSALSVDWAPHSQRTITHCGRCWWTWGPRFTSRSLSARSCRPPPISTRCGAWQGRAVLTM